MTMTALNIMTPSSAVATADPHEKKRLSNIESLVCAFLASLTTGGTTYAFGLYGAALKETLEISQSQLDTISTAFFFAGLCSWLPGMCADQFGTRFALTLGGVTGCSALLLYWTVARQFVSVSSGLIVPCLSLLGIAIFLSSALVTGSVFKIIVASCGAGTKGSAVGVAKGYVGLGSGAYACLFEALRRRGESDLDFLPMAAFFCIACAVLPAQLLLPTKQQVETLPMQDEATPLHFRTLFGSLACMAVLVIGNSIAELREDDSVTASTGHGPRYGMALLFLTVWLAPILWLLHLPRRSAQGATRDGHHALAMVEVVEDDVDDLEEEASGRIVADVDDDLGKKVPTASNDALNHSNDDDPLSRRNSASHKENGGDDEAEQENLLLRQARPVDEANGIERDDSSVESSPEPEAEENYNLFEMLMTPSAWLMLWTTTILVGAGTVETNNMGQMVESLGFSRKVTPACLALFSVAQAAARVATGALSESALNWNVHGFCIDNGVPRPFFLVVASLIGFCAHFLLGLATHKVAFVFGAILSGWAFGMVWPLMVLIVGEVFGTRHVGANYMFFDGGTSAIGTLLLTKIVAQDVYESHIDPSAADQLSCFGYACFRATHMVVAILSLTCVGTSFGLLYTSRRVYNKPGLHRS